MDEPKRYESIKHIVSVIGFVLDVLILIYLLISGASISIRNFAEGVAHSEAAAIAVYTLILTGLFKAFDLPLGFYSGYVIEHRFGLSRQTVAGWLRDQMKGLGLGVLLSLAGAEVIYKLLRSQPDRWWVYTSLAFVTFVVVMTYVAPVLLLPLFFKFR